MTDDDRRAEIEAVAKTLAELDGEEPAASWRNYERQAGAALAALDHVRDARGDDEPRNDREKFGAYPSLSAQCADGRHRECFTSQVCRCECHRSPQDEDHEARPEQPPPDTL